MAQSAAGGMYVCESEDIETLPLTLQQCCRMISKQFRRASMTRDIADRKSTRLNSSHQIISYAVFCLKKKSTRLNSSHQIISYAVFCLNKKITTETDIHYS